MGQMLYIVASRSLEVVARLLPTSEPRSLSVLSGARTASSRVSISCRRSSGSPGSLSTSPGMPDLFRHSDQFDAVTARVAARAIRPRRLRSWALHEPPIERPEYQDNADVHYQPLPEVVPEEQDVHADHDGYQREHVKHDGCLFSHRFVSTVCEEVGQERLWPRGEVRHTRRRGNGEILGCRAPAEYEAAARQNDPQAVA